MEADAVIVDETSMVDLALMRALLAALRPGCRLVLVGDPDQLLSVGAGNVFGDLIRSERVATVALKDIFRQAEQSAIVRSAHLVNEGQLPELQNTAASDFFFLPAATACVWWTRWWSCAERGCPKRCTFPPRAFRCSRRRARATPARRRSTAPCRRR
ncbi:MAG: AAA family ATPase [Oscillospiraceae bacterium]